MNKKSMATIEVIVTITLIILVLLFVITYSPKIVDLAKTSLGLGKFENVDINKPANANQVKEEDSFSKIPECEIGDKCKVTNPPCKCLTSEKNMSYAQINLIAFVIPIKTVVALSLADIFSK